MGFWHESGLVVDEAGGLIVVCHDAEDAGGLTRELRARCARPSDGGPTPPPVLPQIGPWEVLCPDGLRRTVRQPAKGECRLVRETRVVTMSLNTLVHAVAGSWAATSKETEEKEGER